MYTAAFYSRPQATAQNTFFLSQINPIILDEYSLNVFSSHCGLSDGFCIDLYWKIWSRCLRFIGDYPTRTPNPHLHSTLSLEPIHEFIFRFYSSTTALHTPTLSFAKYWIILYSISTCSIENIYTNGSNTYYCKPYTGSCSVFYIVLIFHCWYLYVFHSTYRNNQSDTVVNWLLEQFVASHVLYEYRSNKT